MRVLCLDNSVVGDLLEGEDYITDFVRGQPPEAEIVVPSLVRFEAYVYAHSPYSSVTSQETAYALDAFRTVGFDEAQAREAAEIRANLLANGNEIGPPDVLIAGVARSIGAEMVTTDGHFDRVPELPVHNLVDQRDSQ